MASAVKHNIGNEVQFTDNAIDNFLAFIDYMSVSADTYVLLGGSNGCADQLTNWDGTQKWDWVRF